MIGPPAGSEPALFEPVADAIVVAAGASSRMGGLDKLDAVVAGRPLLAWALAALSEARLVERIVIVTAAERLAAIESAAWLPGSVAAVVAGGPRRQESVAAGIACLERLDRAADTAASGRRVVLVHDGARPCLTPVLADTVARSAAEHGAAIPVVPVAETLKRRDGDRITATVDRSALVAAQTPQGVRRDVLRSAYAAVPPDGPETFTDEASLLEACGVPVRAVDGDPANLKVTLPADLARAAALLTVDRPPRTGLGQDSHPFGPGSSLALGGIEIAGAPRLYGHSDGDVLLHAVADALIGGAGLGDLGRLFPADARTPAGIASSDLLAEVVRRVGSAGYRPTSIDAIVVAARPRLAVHLPAMAAAIAAIAGLDPATVSVKASTGNLAGMEGAGRGISAQVVAVLVPAPGLAS